MEEEIGRVWTGARRRENGEESWLQSPCMQDGGSEIRQVSSRGRLGLLKGPIQAHPEPTW